MSRMLLPLSTIALSLGCLAVPLEPQLERRTLDHDDYAAWHTIRGTTLSARGGWLAYTLRPGDEGDGTLRVLALEDGGRETTIERGDRARIDFGQGFCAYRIAPARDDVRQAEKDDVPKKKRPKDGLGILDLASGQVEEIERVTSFALPEKRGGWIAWRHYEPLKKKDDDEDKEEAGEKEQEEEGKEKEGDKKDKKRKKDGTELVLRELATGAEQRVQNVLAYTFSEDGRWLACATSTKDGSDDSVRVLAVGEGNEHPIFTGEGEHKSLAFSEDGRRLAFLSNRDDYAADQPRWTLYLWEDGAEEARAVATADTDGMPAGWGVAEHRAPSFSKDGGRLFFGTAPLPEPEPEEPFEDEKVVVDVWSWTDDRIQPLQLEELEDDRKRSHLAVLHLGRGERIVQLGREHIPRVVQPKDRGSRYALGVSDLPYRHMSQWDGQVFRDLVRIDVESGAVEPLLQRRRGSFSISPGGGYAVWWDGEERSWFALDLERRSDPVNIGEDVPFPLEYELHDTPSLPRSNGSAGWLANDAGFLVYDTFDVWLLDPSGAPARCVTDGHGRAENVRLRVVDLDPDEEAIDPEAPLLLSALDRGDRSAGFWRVSITGEGNGGGEPEVLLMEARRFSTPVKAEEADVLRFTRESFTEFPDVWVSDLDFASPRRVSDANPQQAQFRWGTSELVSWTSADGVPLEGILYKPDDFDPARKYPLLAYFYERSSDRLHSHQTPLPNRSSVRFPFYVSRGYLVFVPDIPYETGFPGQSAVRAVVSGVLHLVDAGFVDRDAIGIQGHSWGGYQVAYLITQTDLFAAAVGGAVVSNMTSAYGGIRYGSGRSRQFQYEKTQSRIGATLWEAPQRYVDNSPVFFADRVETPLVMMHNDKDGAVPWTQGIELFMALKRLGKPVWLLNYNGEPHGLGKYANRRDYMIRMQQFFDHYLKGAPAPEWMVEGVPALEKGRTLGLELVEEEAEVTPASSSR